jgi:DNA-binding CsgD family transcriptional regulator
MTPWYTGAMKQGIHTILWILAYSAALAAFVLGVILARRQPSRFSSSLRTLLLEQLILVALITALYQASIAGLLDTLADTSRALVSVTLNGAAYVAFALFVSSLPSVFLQDATETPAGRVAWAARWLLVTLALLLTVSNLALATIGAPGMNTVRRVAAVGWFVYGALLCAVVVWAGAAAFLDYRRLPLTRPAAAAFVVLFLGFVVFEVVPQLGRISRGGSYYFLLPACLIVLSLFLSLAAVRLLAFQNAEGQKAAGTDNEALSVLSPRESEIANLLASGKAYKEIAYDLHVAMSTVQTHVFRIYTKLSVNNKVELVNRLRG